MNSSAIIDSIHPMGQTKYRKVRLGYRGKIRYTHKNRKAHMNINVATVAATGFPMPRRAAPKISLIPQIK